MKATGLAVSLELLRQREERAAKSGYAKAKWIEFCETMLAEGYTAQLYEARGSVSKYITVFNLGLSFKVRFSNHGATHRGAIEDCDFFVGKNRFGTRTTAQAIEATIKALGTSPFKKEATNDRTSSPTETTAPSPAAEVNTEAAF